MLGKLLAGRYKVIDHLGEGGFGKTYLAQDHKLPGNPKCVVKQLKPLTPKVLPTARKLFDREAKCLQDMGKHDRIPQLFAYFDEEEEFYLVEEYIEGNPLSQELNIYHKLSEGEVIAILQEILSILEFVHQQKVIHRDIKPSNIIRRKQDGKLVLIDFGSVKQLSIQNLNPHEQEQLTVAISTAGYTPIEQLQGKPSFSSDIYALGITAIQALTGNNPRDLQWDPNTGQVIWHHQAAVSSQIANILDKMVSPSLRDRYQSVGEVINELGNCTKLLTETTQIVSEIRSPSSALTEARQEASPANSVPSSIVTSHPGTKLSKFSLPTLKPWQGLVFLGGITAILGIAELIYPIIRPVYQLHRGEKLLESQQLEDALDSFQSVIKMRPKNAEGWEGRGDALRLLDRNQAALATYDKALHLRPNDSETWNKKGRALYKQGKSEQALSAQEKAIKFDSNNARAWSDKGIALIGLQRYEEALEAFKKAKKLKPQDPTVWQNQALALEYLKRHQEAIEVYEEAVVTYTEALSANPKDPVAWVDRGGVLSKLKRHEEALYSYEKAIEVSPKFYLAWHNKGDAFYFLRRYEEALAAYDQALKIRPKSYRTWHNRGSLLAAEKGDFEEAIKSFDKVIQIKPSFYHAWRDRGLALSNLERYPEAIASFNKALEIQPKDHQSWMGQGIALMKLDRNQEALAAFDRAKEIQPNNPYIWANRGLVLEKMRSYQKARDSYREALRIDPTFPLPTQALE
ncbi:MAG: tetratricopeptide repeat protein [Symploca sp. SIO3C6]|uniref:Tetratricopeptide repeat protein n=1 Tax=Symploca sp. SIO1C4 TaxID=2607765 RepID=A0A6B3NQY4_9CYAN|nr:tetratricopeptide repeat protein [Symploca sp. SIO3C6]NER31648.1 tetratricopeptide repeat protein [Symploca sp. SIO1C4]NET04823.1 tetratricopeptide repeat protein [Symploca sp. SIO2B6]